MHVSGQQVRCEHKHERALSHFKARRTIKTASASFDIWHKVASNAALVASGTDFQRRLCVHLKTRRLARLKVEAVMRWCSKLSELRAHQEADSARKFVEHMSLQQRHASCARMELRHHLRLQVCLFAYPVSV